MPTYDYHCDTCGREFEWFQSIKEPKLVHCPESICQNTTKGTGTVQRKISGGSGLIFNGDGFYLTDYVKNAGSKSAGSTSSSTKAGDAAASGSATGDATSSAAPSNAASSNAASSSTAASSASDAA
jgi:putative FmdB family regulatory protein